MVSGKYLVVFVWSLVSVRDTLGHGRLIEPPGRSSAWRFGFNTPRNDRDNELFCGGFTVQQSNGGKCGVCGDRFDGVRENEAGGRYATGTIVRTYTSGQVITVTAQLTVNHKGWMEYRICPHNDVTTPVTQECLDKYVLQRADGQGSKLAIPGGITGNFSMDCKLPDGMTCAQCVIQWKYHAGNSWGVDPDTGKACTGCGPQEEFYGCGDVSIVDSVYPISTTHKSQTTIMPTTPTSTMHKSQTTTPYAAVESTTPSAATKAQAGVSSDREGHCYAVNEFKGQHQFNQWCIINCARAYCPPHICSCKPREQKTDSASVPTTKLQPLSARSTLHTVSSTAPATRTDNPASAIRPKTRSSTLTTLSKVPSTEARVSTEGALTTSSLSSTTKNPLTVHIKSSVTSRSGGPVSSGTSSRLSTAGWSSSPSQTEDKLICKAIGTMAGFSNLDRWCAEKCNAGQCPTDTCRCTTVQIVTSQMISTTSRSVTSPTSTSQSGFSRCVTNGVVEGVYWDKWCQVQCERGYCESHYCLCY